MSTTNNSHSDSQEQLKAIEKLNHIQKPLIDKECLETNKHIRELREIQHSLNQQALKWQEAVSKINESIFEKLLDGVNKKMEELIETLPTRDEYKKTYENRSKNIEALGEFGWIIPWSSDFRDLNELSMLLRTDGPEAVGKWFVSFYEEADETGITRFDNLGNTLLESSLLTFSKNVIQECLDAYHQGFYGLVISSLFPCIDGTLFSLVKEKRSVQNRWKEGIAKPQETTILMLFWLGITKALATLFESYPSTNPEPQRLNRHWVLHGLYRNYKYDTKENALRLFVLLEGLVRYFR